MGARMQARRAEGKLERSAALEGELEEARAKVALLVAEAQRQKALIEARVAAGVRRMRAAQAAAMGFAGGGSGDARPQGRQGGEAKSAEGGPEALAALAAAADALLRRATQVAWEADLLSPVGRDAVAALRRAVADDAAAARALARASALLSRGEDAADRVAAAYGAE